MSSFRKVKMQCLNVSETGSLLSVHLQEVFIIISSGFDIHSNGHVCLLLKTMIIILSYNADMHYKIKSKY